MVDALVRAFQHRPERFHAVRVDPAAHGRQLLVEELLGVAALGWFGRHSHYGWAYCHRHAGRMISAVSVGYVCGLGQHWMRGFERWEGPPHLPTRLAIGGDTA